MAENQLNIETKEISVKDIRSKFEAKVKDKGADAENRPRRASTAASIKEDSEKHNKESSGAEGNITNERSSVSNIIKQFQKKIDSSQTVKIPQPITTNVAEKKVDSTKVDKPLILNIVDQKLGLGEKARQQQAEQKEKENNKAETNQLHEGMNEEEKEEKEEIQQQNKTKEEASPHQIEDEGLVETVQNTYAEGVSSLTNLRDEKPTEAIEIEKTEEGLAHKDQPKSYTSLKGEEEETTNKAQQPGSREIKTDEEEGEEHSALTKSHRERSDQQEKPEKEEVAEKLKLKKNQSENVLTHSSSLNLQPYVTQGPLNIHEQQEQKKKVNSLRDVGPAKQAEQLQVQTKKHQLLAQHHDHDKSHNFAEDDENNHKESTPLTGSQADASKADYNKHFGTERLKSSPLSPSFNSIDLGDLGSMRFQATEEAQDTQCNRTLNLDDLVHPNVEENHQNTEQQPDCCHRSFDLLKNCVSRLFFFKKNKKTYSEFAE